MSPEEASRILSDQGAHNFIGLRSVLEHATTEWMITFLNCDGLQHIVARLRECTKPGTLSHLDDAVVAIDGARCLRAVMNRSEGMDYLVHSDNDCVQDMTLSLDSYHLILKQHIWELLSAVCLYSQPGRMRVISALENYALIKACRYRFSLVIQELAFVDCPGFYYLAVITFVNSLLKTNDFEQRLRIRRELVALGILEEIGILRDRACDSELMYQIDLFSLNHAEDWSEFSMAPVNLLDARSVFDALFDKTCRTPLSDRLLSVMQLLLAIDGTIELQEQLWSYQTKHQTHYGHQADLQGPLKIHSSPQHD